MTNSELGMLGLGLLGGAMADRFIERGVAVVGYDPDAARRRTAAVGGVAIVADAAAVIRRCDRVVLSLPHGEAVALLLEAIAPYLRAGQTIIDTTTASPEQMTRHAEFVRARGAKYVECEIAGSSAQARRGDVSAFVAGTEADFATLRELLKIVAADVRYVGPPGAAAKLKLVHNLVLGLHRAVLAEGLTFAESLGLDAAATLEVLRHTPAASVVMTTKGAKMAARDFAPQATIRQHRKDVGLILAAAAKSGAYVPLSQRHDELLAEAAARGHAEHDNTAIIAAFERSGDTGPANDVVETTPRE